MGNTSYNSDTRFSRSVNLGYMTKDIGEIFTQSRSRRVHESMSSDALTIRECRDSVEHPNTLPVILSLDVTGSMGKIPHMLIQDGLPQLMGKIIQEGFNDTSLMFTAIGDHECDQVPLQVGQFESGDAELDMWLTRTFLEGRGGGNDGESYHLTWLTAARHTVTDAWEKRGEKGILVTIGDEPVLKSLPQTAQTEIFGESYISEDTNLETLLAAAQEKWDVYHIHLTHHEKAWGALGVGCKFNLARKQWKDLLGDNLIICDDHNNIPSIVSDLVIERAKNLTISEYVQPVTTEFTSVLTEDAVGTCSDENLI